VHGANEPPSSAHWNSTVLTLSLPSKRKLSTPDELGSGGVSSSCVVGAIPSVFGAAPPSHLIV
jgi:hypothetical protein